MGSDESVAAPGGARPQTGHDKVGLSFDHGGAVARLFLAAPKANVIDAGMIAGLEQSFDELEKRRGMKAIVLGAEGPHFSFGASVEEHLPEAIEGALARLHRTLRRMQALPAPTIAAVRGQCLGGGLELALGCDLIVAESGARLGCPEIKLGVFAPAATALLPLRIAGGSATRALLTGESCSAEEATRAGLVDRLAPEGELESVLQAWLQEDFLPRSAVGLRHAAFAVRRRRSRALEEDLAELEKAYVEQLMAEPDAVEGIRAFLEKREPRWREVAH